MIGALVQEAPLPEAPDFEPLQGQGQGKAQSQGQGKEQGQKQGQVPNQGQGQGQEEQREGQGEAQGWRGSVVSCAQVRRMGDVLLRLLFDMKHSGAVDKSAIALSALTSRLLK